MLVEDDIRLWDEFRRGSESAFSRMYNGHIRSLLSYGTKLSSDINLVEDCIHDLFIELWDRKAFLGDTSSIKLYLFKGLKRKIIHALVRNRKNALSSDLDPLEEEYTFNFTLSYETEWVEQQAFRAREEKLGKVLEKLPKAQREVVYLRFFAGMSYEEIASLMAINYQSVNNHVYRAMKSLRKELTDIILMLAVLFHAWL
jgi:RNA polymerase sigma factor (sigma-70 family)